MTNKPNSKKPDFSMLETFPNPYPQREYSIQINIPEFTSLCPKTGQPDFGIIEVEYVPGEKCLELKSLKLYCQAWRNVGAFYEQLTNDILEDLVKSLSPRHIMVEASFTPRGGIDTVITAEYSQDDQWQLPD